LVVFSPDGRLIATAGSDGKVRVWSAETGQPFGTPIALALDIRDWVISGMAISHDGKTLAVNWKEIQLWDIATGLSKGPAIPSPEVNPEFPEFPQRKYELRFANEDRTLVLILASGKCVGWDVGTGQRKDLSATDSMPGQLILGSPEGEPGLNFGGGGWHANAYCFMADGRLLLKYSEPVPFAIEPRAQLWDVRTKRPVGPSHVAPLTIGEFFLTDPGPSPDGRTFLTTQGGRKRFWSAPEPLPGEVERLVRWVEVLTGRELDPDGEVRSLDASTWRQRRQRLQELGGPPLP
jgi:hypothetical protein